LRVPARWLRRLRSARSAEQSFVKLIRPRGNALRAVVDCPECGEARVDPGDVTVLACLDTDRWSYRFTCPGCRRRSVAATSRVSALRAVESGAQLETWSWPAELGERSSLAPPLTLDDLLDLRVSVSEPDWLETLARPNVEADA